MALLPLLVLLSPEGLAGNRTINQSGVPLSWQTDTVPFFVDPSGKHGLDPDAVYDTIVLGAEQWQAEGSWVTLDAQGERDIDEFSYNESCEVFFADSWINEADDIHRDPSLLALTYVWSDQVSGEILEFDIAINADDHRWTLDGEAGLNDMWNAMTHEFGHGLGFDHSEDEAATMFSHTSPGDIEKRDLATDDMSLFSAVYGGTFPFEAVGRMSCSAAPGSPAGLAVLVGLVGLVGRRRRVDAEGV